MTNEKILFHSEFLVKLVNEGEVEECTVNSVMKSLVYGLLYELGTRRIEVNKKLESLLKNITDGNVKSTSEINQVRSEIITLYSDSSALYYLSKKLSKFLDKEVEDDCLFAYDRAEILITRESELYNIYLTEIQNDLNIVIKKLTSISFIFLPITAVASILAISFNDLPSNLNSPYFGLSLVLLVLLGIALTIYLRKIDWL
ncbi:CorA family divalent cation transporter [Sulfolobus acidocaldarius]|uniref:CorA family divalent cation transporter n=1 Tax=Sulfolobus acidocaldarius TaxID=2285 RepID=UPI0009B59DA2|nr:CorA family divalent cation transporter [Sulfolobus acidocaldarius]WCM33933.1 magnesium transporter CorA family protein [Sulfolobus acidocaldarius DSM 639]